MTYLDANVFIFAACDLSPIGEAARKILRMVQEGDQKAITSALTYDEVVWGIRKLLGKEKSQWVGELFLFISHLSIKEVTRETLSEAQHFMKHYNLDPRDAIHLATMRLENEGEIISEDADFDAVPFIKRIPLGSQK